MTYIVFVWRGYLEMNILSLSDKISGEYAFCSDICIMDFLNGKVKSVINHIYGANV